MERIFAVLQLIILFQSFDHLMTSTIPTVYSYTSDVVTNTSNIISTSSVPINCSIETDDINVQQQIRTFILAEKELIFLHFYLPNFHNIFHFKANSTIYKVLDLVKTKGGHGNELLLMHPQFEQLSIGLLMFGVEHVSVPLKELPSQCFTNVTEEQFQEDLLEFASNKFNLLERNGMDEKERLCKMHVENDDGRAIFFYKCCFLDVSGNFVCNRMASNQWITVLFFAMSFAYVLAFLFSPLLIPTSWYTKIENSYLLKIVFPYKLEITKEENSIISNDKIGYMIKFSEKVQKLLENNSVVLKVEDVKFKIEGINTVTSKYVPAGILDFLYKTLIKCQIKDHDYVKDCCYSPIGVCPEKQCCMWHKCLKPLMQVVFLVIIFTPLFIRIIFFYIFEEKDRTDREVFSSDRNLQYPDFFEWNLTYSLKPDHPFFIVCYVSILFMPVFKTFLKYTLQDSSIDKIGDKIDLSSRKVVKKLIKPCKKYGFIGILIGPLYWIFITPYILLKYILPSIPILNISFTIVYSLIIAVWDVSKETWDEEGKCLAICGLPILISIVILLFWSTVTCMILCLEVVIFFLQILLYVAIGIILNASLVLTYVTFAGMLLFYAYDTIRNVKKKYEAFSQAVIEYFITDMQDSIKSTLTRERNIHNCAFLINLNKNQQSLKSDSVSSFILHKEKPNKLFISTKHPFLFFDNSKPFISEVVFFKMCYMNMVRAPGSLWESYKKAFVNFIVIVLFLIFVAIIVLAFGQTQGVPGTYQAIATLGGGLIPLILRRYFFKSEDSLDFKSDHFLFREEMKRVLEGYNEIWEILDISGEEADSAEMTGFSFDEIKVKITPKKERKSISTSF